MGATGVLQLVRTLESRPSVVAIDGVGLRFFEGPGDIDSLMALRRKAFADEEFTVRDWSRADFEREFLEKSWWCAERMWLAESDDGVLVGTVTLAERGAGTEARPAVHWLAVLPAWRRRGVGSLLMAALEARVGTRWAADLARDA